MQTARLTLRPLTIDDAPRIASLAGDWDVASMTGRIPYPYGADAALHWVVGLADGEVVYGIEHNDELIGMCGYTPTVLGAAEVGYWIGKPYWGQGYATEATDRLIEHGFKVGGVRRFTCSHFTENDASKRVITKLGFVPMGQGTGWCEARGIEMPTLRYQRRRPLLLALKALTS